MEAPALQGFCALACFARQLPNCAAEPRSGRRRAMAVSGDTDELGVYPPAALRADRGDEPTAQKTAALRVAVRWAPAVSQGSTDGHRIALRLAPGGSSHRTATPAVSIWENQAPR